MTQCPGNTTILDHSSHTFRITKYEYFRFLVHYPHWSQRYTHLFCTEFLYILVSVPPHTETAVKLRICLYSILSRYSKSVQNQSSSQQCCWRFRCFGMWCSITGRVVLEVLKDQWLFLGSSSPKNVSNNKSTTVLQNAANYWAHNTASHPNFTHSST